MKLVEAVNDLITRINELLEEESYSDFLLERLFRMKAEIVDPAVNTLRAHPLHAERADALLALYQAIEQYVMLLQQSPERREERRQKVEGAKSLVRRVVLGRQDQEGEVEILLDEIRQWQWKTSLDASGRLVYSTGSGTVVPARGLIAEKVGPQVIEQAVKAQRPYSDKMRPRDVRGEPGGLILLEGERAICVGDLHGRYDNLEYILKDKNNIQNVLAGRTHLIFVGDAVHPSSSAMNSPEAYEDSFCVMLLIMTLKAENPFNIHYLIGNHDAAHVGGVPAGRGQVRQDKLFKKFVVTKFGRGVFDRYCEFVRMSPVVAKLKTSTGNILLLHASISPRILSEQGLINIFTKGRQGKALQDLLWSRNYGKEAIEKALASVGAKFIISGHTGPTQSRAARYGFEVIAEGVAAHVHERQIILNAQGNTFGYVDIDMTKPLPEKVTDLCAPDGKPAFRILRPRGAPPEPPPAAVPGFDPDESQADLPPVT